MFNWNKRESGAKRSAAPLDDREIPVQPCDDAESLFDSDIGPLLYAIEPELKRMAAPIEL